MNMHLKFTEMIDRYVYAVIKRLPTTQQEDVDRELRSLIEDMLQAKKGQEGSEESHLEEVLVELGNPWELSANYREKKSYLIGPDHYELYELIVKIVLGATSLGIIIAMIIGYIFNPPQSVFSTIGSFIGTVISVLMQSFAGVTIIFALVERYSTEPSSSKKAIWKISDLPEVPTNTKGFSRTESIVGIVFLVIFLIVLNVSPSLFTTRIIVGKVWIISPFNSDVFIRLLPLINATLVLSILTEFAKIYFKFYSPRLALLTISMATVSLFISIYIIGAAGIWNPNFAQELQSVFPMGDTSVATFSRFWNNFPIILIVLLVVGYVVETITTLYRSFKGRIKSFT
jgi:hypothetical protein